MATKADQLKSRINQLQQQLSASRARNDTASAGKIQSQLKAAKSEAAKAAATPAKTTTKSSSTKTTVSTAVREAQAKVDQAKKREAQAWSQLNNPNSTPALQAKARADLKSAQEAAQKAQTALDNAKKQEAAKAATPAKTTTTPAKATTPTKTTTPASTTTPAPSTIAQLRPATSPLSFDDFMKTGFYGSANIAALQELLANYNLTDAAARQQAEAQYRPEYDLQRVELENQLAQLGVDRDREIKNLNTQYDRTLNSVMAELNARRFGRSSLVATRGVETENARNSAISNASYNYLTKQNEVNANLQRANLAYAQNVENRATELKNENDAQRLQLMMNIAQLQQAGYSAYANYLTQRDALSVDEQQLANEQLQYQINQKKLDNEQLQYGNNEAKLGNEQLQNKIYQKKYDNEVAQYGVNQKKLENEGLQVQNQQAQLANRQYELKLAKKNS